MLARDGLVLKPLQGASTLASAGACSRGDSERLFYAELSESAHPLSQHLPKYYGTETVLADDGVTRDYIKLEDITSKVHTYRGGLCSAPCTSTY